MPRITLAAVAVLLCPSLAGGQTFRPEPGLGYGPLSGNAVWGGIYSKRVGEKKNLIVLQVYDLKYCAVDALLFGISSMGNWDGLHHPDPVNPCFRKMSCDSALMLYRALHGDRVLTLTNGVFFESPSDSANTALSYPLILGGTVVSSGASRYGPGSGGYPLKALEISDSSAAITEYDCRTAPRKGAAPTSILLVTLNYRDHPNVREFPGLPGGYRTRYHLLSLVRRDPETSAGTVVIISSNFDLSILELADEMRRVCPSVRDEEILTLDGGASISLQTGDATRLIDPARGVKVPMYLGFRRRTSGNLSQGAAAVRRNARFMNPRHGEAVASTHVYFIFYLSSDTTNEFELYQQNNLISKLRNAAAHPREGFFVFDPLDYPPGEGYRLKMLGPSGNEACSGTFSIK